VPPNTNDDPSEHRPIRWLQSRADHLAAQDGNLMSEHDHFNGQVLLLATQETGQLEGADEGNVEEGECHAPCSSPGSRQRSTRPIGPIGVFGTSRRQFSETTVFISGAGESKGEGAEVSAR
jgi:hypothetical protein